MTDVSAYSVSLHFIQLGFIILTIDSSLLPGVSGQNTESERHIHLGVELMTRGQFVDALSHFHVAIDGDPNNYLTYFRRATAYLALGKSKTALADLDMVIQLKPDFISAWVQRGNILLKQGRLDEAHINFEAVLRRDPNNPESLAQYGAIEPVRQHMLMAQMLVDDRDHYEAIQHLSHAIEVCPWDPILREMRADCHIATGETMAAVIDLKAVTRLRGDSTQAHYRLSILHYELGETEDSLNEIRQCLKLDADNKECFPHYKKVKKLDALLRIVHEFLGSGKYVECIEKAKTIDKIESQVEAYKLVAKSVLCHCHSKSGSTFEAISICTDALRVSETVELLCSRAEAHINNDDFDQALSDFQRAHSLDSSAVCARDGVSRAQRLQKQAKRRDYYKVLSVSRTATKKEILRAYRKLAQKWHPDSFDGDEKKMAEIKFIEIAAAKEVLTDPEKRKRFDSGEDPLEPETRSNHGFNPFGQGFHPFDGAGPFQFKFQFN